MDKTKDSLSFIDDLETVEIIGPTNRNPVKLLVRGRAIEVNPQTPNEMEEAILTALFEIRREKRTELAYAVKKAERAGEEVREAKRDLIYIEADVNTVRKKLWPDE